MLTNIKQALLWAGMPKSDDFWTQKAQNLAIMLEDTIPYKTVMKVMDVTHTDDGVILNPGNLILEGDMAKTMLEECDQAVLFAATLGVPFDRLLKRYQLQDMADAVLVDALGSSYIEGVCDQLEQKIQDMFPQCYLTDRFSCGYGDLPLQTQKAIGKVLSLPSSLGVQVLDSNMMNPTKSVSAILGIAKTPQPARIRGCSVCLLKNDCSFHKNGTVCWKTE